MASGHLCHLCQPWSFWTVRWSMTVFENGVTFHFANCKRLPGWVVSGLPHPNILRTSHHLGSIDFPGDVRAKNLWISRLFPLPNCRPISFHEFSRRDQPSILTGEVQMVHVNYPLGISWCSFYSFEVYPLVAPKKDWKTMDHYVSGMLSSIFSGLTLKIFQIFPSAGQTQKCTLPNMLRKRFGLFLPSPHQALPCCQMP